jgi:hypothetical protein
MVTGNIVGVCRLKALREFERFIRSEDMQFALLDRAATLIILKAVAKRRLLCMSVVAMVI